MFEAIGRRGHTKVLDAGRWVSSSGSALFLLALLVAAVNVVANGPKPPLPLPEPTVPPVVRLYFPPAIQPVNPPPATTQPRPRPPASSNTLPRQVKPQPIPEPVASSQVAPSQPAPDTAMTDPAPEASGTGGIISTIPFPEGPGNGPGWDGTTDEVQEVSFGDVRILEQCRLQYPSLAMRARITGEVLVEVTCSTDGRVSDVRWISGNEVFKDAVEECLRSTRYAAQPIPFRFRQPFRFQLR